MERLLVATDIVSGLATVFGVIGWMSGTYVRWVLGRPIQVADWVLHGAGLGGGLGLLLAAIYLTT